MPQREERSEAGDRLSLDIGALKRQYARLRERQRQAHVILAAACARHAAGMFFIIGPYNFNKVVQNNASYGPTYNGY